MIQRTKAKAENRIESYYAKQSEKNTQTKLETSLNLEDLIKVSVGLESIFRLSSNVQANLFHSPINMLATSSLISHWLNPVIGSDGASLDNSLERGLQDTPGFRANDFSLSAVKDHEARIDSAVENAEAIIKHRGKTVSKKQRQKGTSPRALLRNKLEAIEQDFRASRTSLIQARTEGDQVAIREAKARGEKARTEHAIYSKLLKSPKISKADLEKSSQVAETILTRLEQLRTTEATQPNLQKKWFGLRKKVDEEHQSSLDEARFATVNDIQGLLKTIGLSFDNLASHQII